MTSALNNWSLARKMLTAFSLIALLLLGVAVTGIVGNTHLAGISERHVKRGIGGIDALSRLENQLREKRIIIYSMHNADPSEMQSLEDRFEKTKQDTATAISDYSEVAGEFMPEVEKLKAMVQDLDGINEKIFRARLAGDSAGSLALIKGEGKKISRAAIDEAEHLGNLNHDRSVASDRAGQDYASSSKLFAILLSVLSLAGLGVIWMLISRTVAKPMAEVAAATTTLANGGTADVPHRDRNDELGQIAKAVELFRQAAVERAAADARIAAEQQTVTSSLELCLDALSKGDLSNEVTQDFPPAYAALKTNFNAAISSLRQLIGAVSESAAQIRTGSSEIAQASEDLARRTESNAASLEETSAALAQIDGRIKATAGAAERTVERADQAIATVGGGRAIADEAVQAMGRVSESAKGIDNVIEGLDKIAFQTRVLAMNAAVEAGRAGDAGRGFAVVADLVSALAMRAEEEAKRARDQLTVTQTDIVAAVDAVQKVDGALQDISGDVGEVHGLLGTMAADNQAQATAITQISSAITSMDQATQQNAAMVEQTSAAARNLTSEVETLSSQAAQFTVSRDGRSAPRPVPSPQSFVPAASTAGARARKNDYVSPVKALPVPAGSASAGGDWKDF